MAGGIPKKIRNTLFDLLIKSGHDIRLFDSHYDEKKRTFLICILDENFGFEIKQSETDIDFYDYIDGDALHEDKQISDSGDVDDVFANFKDWLSGPLALFIEHLNSERITQDKWESLKDPITRKYKEEFEEEFKLVDETAETEPFNLEQQLYLEEYLNKVIDNIDKYKNGDNDAYIEEIKKDSEELKNEIPQLTKNETVSRLSTIWAKMRKAGLIVLKELFIAVKGEIISAVIKGIIGM